MILSKIFIYLKTKISIEIKYFPKKTRNNRKIVSHSKYNKKKKQKIPSKNSKWKENEKNFLGFSFFFPQILAKQVHRSRTFEIDIFLTILFWLEFWYYNIIFVIIINDLFDKINELVIVSKTIIFYVKKKEKNFGKPHSIFLFFSKKIQRFCF